MPQRYRCSVCQETPTFSTRNDAMQAGWTFVEAVNQHKVKYWAICGKHSQLAWLKAALGEEKQK